MGITISSGYIF